ncbi:hypothetical protein V498_08818, partial [Pseudogymnoascus sp. VKM F-4517 (FW-2822)]
MAYLPPKLARRHAQRVGLHNGRGRVPSTALANIEEQRQLHKPQTKKKRIYRGKQLASPHAGDKMRLDSGYNSQSEIGSDSVSYQQKIADFNYDSKGRGILGAAELKAKKEAAPKDEDLDFWILQYLALDTSKKEKYALFVNDLCNLQHSNWIKLKGYTTIEAAEGAMLFKKHKEAQANINNLRRQLSNALLDKTIKEFHTNVYTKEVSRQMQGIFPANALASPPKKYELKEQECPRKYKGLKLAKQQPEHLSNVQKLYKNETIVSVQQTQGPALTCDLCKSDEEARPVKKDKVFARIDILLPTTLCLEDDYDGEFEETSPSESSIIWPRHEDGQVAAEALGVGLLKAMLAAQQLRPDRLEIRDKRSFRVHLDPETAAILARNILNGADLA